jgi:hypothetical protein
MTRYDVQDDFTRLPVAEVIAVHRYRGLRAIRVLCPLCGRTHLHAWPDGHPQPAVVTADCQRGDYRIQAEKGTPT